MFNLYRKGYKATKAPTNNIEPPLSADVILGRELTEVEKEMFDHAAYDFHMERIKLYVDRTYRNQHNINEKDYIEQTFPEAHLNMPERVQIPTAHMHQLRAYEEM